MAKRRSGLGVRTKIVADDPHPALARFAYIADAKHRRFLVLRRPKAAYATLPARGRVNFTSPRGSDP